MKRTLVWMLAVLLVAIIASPAAAGVFMADMLNVVHRPNLCGKIQISGNVIVLDLFVKDTSPGPECSLTGDADGNGQTFTLCRQNDLTGVSQVLTTFTDTNGNGRINGAEGTKIVKIPAGYARDYEIWAGTINDVNDCSDGGSLEFRTGHKK